MMWLKFDGFFHFRVQRYDFPLKPAIHIYRDFAWEHNKCGTRFTSDATLKNLMKFAYRFRLFLIASIFSSAA